MSQLDLAIAADVSARHVSFLETGRAKPSEEMLLRLGATLEVPLRDQNEMLEAAGYPRSFAEPSFDRGLGSALLQAIERMLAHHEPYPMIVMDDHYDVVRMNGGAMRLLGAFVVDATALPPKLNVMRALFDPALVRPFVLDWERVARDIVARLHREVLHRGREDALSVLLDELLGYPEVPETWRQPDFSVRPDPTFQLRFERGPLRLAFLTTLTVFGAPSNVTLQELQIESYFPLDDETARACERLAGG